ncbi:UvrB/UvrC motif-containing protein [Coraliomargarita akajimensis]|uniref:UvrB/UvrC protein n=1 Tax=Coraliomargarita akajimensis (strain DSM 45221 / IAM 15411 / JCM 23193 / KCTC 12865 / 04OKA010-24) TaxID=583355 RepID=D5EHP5_CORAD|nr:UvrB/UvrC motif-containing protein [Coraliomargarita akajimensis]ADE54086.1 UvrB/UvrC protein [Coraliomargarita akajimensis DSM 45221]
MAEKLTCSLCGKEATVHLTQIINNKMHKVDLCEECAQQKGVTDPEGFALADLLQKSTFTPPKTELKGDDLVCPKCGYESADFRRTGRLGCADCYAAFESQVLPVLEDMHAGVTHKGKVPELAVERQSSQLNLQKLKDALASAIAEEAYEEAAKLRDQIRELEATSAASAMEISLK